MDGRIVGITIDAGTIFEAKARAEQKKQFAETYGKAFDYSIQQYMDAMKNITDIIMREFFKNPNEEDGNETNNLQS